MNMFPKFIDEKLVKSIYLLKVNNKLNSRGLLDDMRFIYKKIIGNDRSNLCIS